MEHQHPEEIEFRGGEVEVRVAPGRDAADRVEREIVESQRNTSVAGTDPTQQRSNAGQQFCLVEWLREIVVGSGVEAVDCGQHVVPLARHRHLQGVTNGPIVVDDEDGRAPLDDASVPRHRPITRE